MEILIVGAGGVGGYFGGKLAHYAAEDDGLSVSFIARGEHLSRIQEDGLVLDCEDGIFRCKPDFAGSDLTAVRQPDLVLLCVKSYDLVEILNQLDPVIKRNTLILPLLNGVDIPQRIRGVLSKGVVLPACVYVGTHISQPGTVSQRGGNARILAGRITDAAIPQKVLADLFERAGISCSFLENPWPEIWGKFIFIAAFGLVCAVRNFSLGELLETAESRREVRIVMDEIRALAEAQGVQLSSGIIEDSFTKAAGFPYRTRTSFQRDYETPGKKDERAIFVLAVVEMGRKYNIPVPYTEKLSALLKNA